MNKRIYVTGSFNGLHHWPGAPDDVAFLRTLHRHKFGVRVDVNVNHSDRDVEFFQFKRVMDLLLRVDVPALLISTPALSCEMLAQFIGETLVKQTGASLYSVEVNEDGENGAILTW
jgi:6-pyruvoyl-tetrahydropterin synthase